MRAIQSVIFVTLCLSFGNCDIPGTLVGLSRIAARAPPPSCANIAGLVCKDCTTLLRCLYAEPGIEKDCRAVNSSTPYCYNGQCVATPQGDDCQAAVPTPTCTGRGYYPDAQNCSRYHLCKDAGAVGQDRATYECPSGYAYNPQTTLCRTISSNADCPVIDCSSDPIGFIPYPLDNNFFIYCTDTESKVYRCLANHVFQRESYSCVFQCPRVGRIPHPTEKTEFTECLHDGTKYIATPYKCVDTWEFSDAKQQCVQSPTQPPLGGK